MFFIICKWLKDFLNYLSRFERYKLKEDSFSINIPNQDIDAVILEVKRHNSLNIKILESSLNDRLLNCTYAIYLMKDDKIIFKQSYKNQFEFDFFDKNIKCDKNEITHIKLYAKYNEEVIYNKKINISRDGKCF